MAASGSSDALALRMLGQILDPSTCTLVTIEGAGSPMQLADRVAELSPAMVILSHLPPEPLAQARYQVRRLRAQFPGWRSWWGAGGGRRDAASEGLSGVGATHVAFTLADARDQILRIVDEQTRRAVEQPMPKALETGLARGTADHTPLIAEHVPERPVDNSAAR